MKQGILPLIPADAADIDGFYSVFRGDTTVTWFHGSYPIRVTCMTPEKPGRG